MTHDPRCPSLRYAVLGDRVCICQTIAEVREDTLARYPFNVNEFRKAVLDEAVQRVEALDLHKHYRIGCDPPSEGYVYAEHLSCDLVAQVTAAIKGDQR